MNKYFILSLFLILTNCSSKPVNTDPEWVHGPTRVVDNGYIVYVGYAQEPTLERAQFKAEGLALEDLANECSMIPKGTRIEDRFNSKEKYTHDAYVKVALEFQECDQARRAVNPDDIKKIANINFTQQLKKYQDLVETGEMPSSEEALAINPPDQMQPPPYQSPGVNDSAHFFIVRQYVAYQKEVVVLSPPGAYAPQSVQTQQFVSNVQPAATQIQQTMAANPKIGEQAWSKIPNRPSAVKPASLSPHMQTHFQALRAPAKPREPGYKKKSHGAEPRRGKKRKGQEEPRE